MLVVSAACDPARSSLQPLLTCRPQTKHAAELCALLVSDLFGELPSVRSLSCAYSR